METYFAIINRNGRWEFVCSGRDPEDVYRQAIEIVATPFGDDENDEPYISPTGERLVDTLRVVPEVIAREKYAVIFTRAYRAE